MYSVLTTEFNFKKRCMSCDIVLSSSLWDTRPVAVQIKRKSIDRQTISGTNRGIKKYQCISCAVKGKSINGCCSFKISIEEIIKFFHLEAKNA